VVIHNARLLTPAPTLDREGFQLVRHVTKVDDFYDPERIKSVYYPEVEGLLKSVTGASRVVVFDHNVRNGANATRDANGVREPVRRVHNDYTAESGPRRVRELLGAEEAEALLRHPFAEINVWRPIRGPLLDAPLALGDARTIAPEHLVPTELRFPDRTGEVYSVVHDPEQRWYYFPRMRRTEAVLIKCYDSRTDGTARFSAHSAFDDPTTRLDAPPRESIEVRSFVFFAPANQRAKDNGRAG
jgi:hypothetical protein